MDPCRRGAIGIDLGDWGVEIIEQQSGAVLQVNRQGEPVGRRYRGDILKSWREAALAAKELFQRALHRFRVNRGSVVKDSIWAKPELSMSSRRGTLSSLRPVAEQGDRSDSECSSPSRLASLAACEFRAVDPARRIGETDCQRNRSGRLRDSEPAGGRGACRRNKKGAKPA